MIDILHDSPVPIHEQIAEQIRVHVASGALKAGVRLPEYRALAQELLTNPQAVARAYGELEADGVLRPVAAGAMEVTTGAGMTCRLRLQDAARSRLRLAVAQALAAGLPESEVVQAFEQGLATARVQPISDDEALRAIKKPTHASRDRAPLGIQDVSRQGGP